MSRADPMPPPLLALDASGEPASAALVTRGGGTACRAAEPGGRAGRVLHGLIAALLAEADLAPSSLAGVVAVRGPGSFTGLRVALAAAQGLALAAGARAGGVESTAALAWASGRPGRVAALVDGGQGRLFVSLHRRDGDRLEVLRPVADLAPEEALELLRREAPEAALVRGRPACLPQLLELGAEPWAGALAGAAAALAGRGLALGPAEPLYLRPPAIRPRRP